VDFDAANPISSSTLSLIVTRFDFDSVELGVRATSVVGACLKRKLARPCCRCDGLFNCQLRNSHRHSWSAVASLS